MSKDPLILFISKYVTIIILFLEYLLYWYEFQYIEPLKISNIGT